MVDKSGKHVCTCPWKMCMCHMKSGWMAFIVMLILNFVYLYVVHAVVMHFVAQHAHANIIFFGVAAFLAALVMAWHRRCMHCHDATEK